MKRDDIEEWVLRIQDRPGVTPCSMPFHEVISFINLICSSKSAITSSWCCGPLGIADSFGKSVQFPRSRFKDHEWAERVLGIDLWP